MTNILLVCMANVCRSPMALAVAKQKVLDWGLAKAFSFDSVGTHAHRSGERIDTRASSVLTRRGYALAKTRSRQITAQDLEQFDLIVAMDESNLETLHNQCPLEYRSKLCLLLDFAPELGLREVPDPYFGNLAGFDRVLTLCEAGVQGLIKAYAKAL